MDERPEKRRGPLLWLADRPWWFWAIVLPTLYLLFFPIALEMGELAGPNSWQKKVATVVYGPFWDLLMWLSPNDGP